MQQRLAQHMVRRVSHEEGVEASFYPGCSCASCGDDPTCECTFKASAGLTHVQGGLLLLSAASSVFVASFSHPRDNLRVRWLSVPS